MARNSVNVNRMFLWDVVGEDGAGRRGGIGLASFTLISQRRCDSPGVCGGRDPGHAGAKAGISTDRCKLELVARSGTNITAIERIESRNPLPIIVDNVLVERNGSKSVVGGSVAEPVRDRGRVWEWLVGISNDAEIYDVETSE